MRENFAWYKGRLIEVTSLPIMCNGVCNGYMQYLRIAEVNHGTYHSGVDCFKKAMELIDAGLEGEWQRRGEGN